MLAGTKGQRPSQSTLLLWAMCICLLAIDLKNNFRMFLKVPIQIEQRNILNGDKSLSISISDQRSKVE